MYKFKKSELKTVNSWIKDKPYLEKVWNIALLTFEEKGLKAAFDYVESENLKYQNYMKSQLPTIDNKKAKCSLEGAWSMKKHLEYLEGLKLDKMLLEDAKKVADSIETDTDKKKYWYSTKVDIEYLKQLISTTNKEWRAQIDEILKNQKEVEEMEQKEISLKEGKLEKIYLPQKICLLYELGFFDIDLVQEMRSSRKGVLDKVVAMLLETNLSNTKKNINALTKPKDKYNPRKYSDFAKDLINGKR